MSAAPSRKKTCKFDARDVTELIIEGLQGSLTLHANGNKGSQSRIKSDGDIRVHKSGTKLVISGTGVVSGTVCVAKGADLVSRNSNLRTKFASGTWGDIKQDGEGAVCLVF